MGVRAAQDETMKVPGERLFAFAALGLRGLGGEARLRFTPFAFPGLHAPGAIVEFPCTSVVCLAMTEGWSLFHGVDEVRVNIAP